MARALEDAATDAGSSSLLRAVDRIAVPQGTWSYPDPGRLLAARIGAPGATSCLAQLGISQQTVVNELLRSIAQRRLRHRRGGRWGGPGARPASRVGRCHGGRDGPTGCGARCGHGSRGRLHGPPRDRRRLGPTRPPVRHDRERSGRGRGPGGRRAQSVRRRAVGTVQRGGAVQSRCRLPCRPVPPPICPRRQPPTGPWPFLTTSGTPVSGPSIRRPPSSCARSVRPGPTTSPSIAGSSLWWPSTPTTPSR